MDCNWCAVCSTHFHSENQASLYCSEECRKADALACCAFHECDHPDQSKNHDHLRFCHHHRPAIRIPSLPLLNLNPNPSAEQQAYGQYQTDEWTRFLQQQYSAQYNSHSAHTSTFRTLSHDYGHGGHGHGHIRVATSQPQLDNYHDTHHVESNSILLATDLPGSGACLQQQIAMQQMQIHQQKSAFHTRQRRASSYEPVRSVFPLSSFKPAVQDITESIPIGNLSLSHNAIETLKRDDGGDDCEKPCMIRKNKVLPPPTLSHIFTAKIANPASLSLSSAVRGNNDGKSENLAIPRSSEGKGGQENSHSHAWPQMDKFFFPDHCCRTSACHSSTSAATTSRQHSINNNNNSNKKGTNSNSNKQKNKKKFVPELPPPPLSCSTTSQGDAGECMALSASIWGTGWRQVEPLPESFVKTIQKSNFAWAGCEREHHRHHRPNARSQRNQNGRSNSVCYDNNDSNNSISGSRMIKGPGHNKSNSESCSSSSSWVTEYSSRLPRSLQFID